MPSFSSSPLDPSAAFDDPSASSRVTSVLSTTSNSTPSTAAFSDGRSSDLGGKSAGDAFLPPLRTGIIPALLAGVVMLVAALSPGVTVCGRILDMPSFTPWASAPSRWGSPAAPLLPPPPPLPGGGFLGEARASCCRGCGRGGSPSGAKGWCSQVGLVQKPCRFCVARVRNTRFHFCIIIHYYGWATVRERNGLSSAGSTSPSLPVGTAVAGQCIKGDPNSKRVCYMQHVTACTGQSAADYDK